MRPPSAEEWQQVIPVRGCVPGPDLTALHVVSHLILTMTLQGRFFPPGKDRWWGRGHKHRATWALGLWTNPSSLPTLPPSSGLWCPWGAEGSPEPTYVWKERRWGPDSVVKGPVWRQTPPPVGRVTLGGPLPSSQPWFAPPYNGLPAPCPWVAGRRGGRGSAGRPRGPGGVEQPCLPALDPLALPAGISSPVKKTEMDKSPFNSPSPQDSPRLSSFTQHHRPVIAVHSGERRGPRAGRGG